MTPLRVMLVAVEPSADTLGAGLAAALRRRLAGAVSFIGVGGPKLAELGLVSAFDPSDLAVLGLFNALAVYPRVLSRADELGRLAARERPDIAVLIDAWGFNLRVAHRLRAVAPNLPLIKYVGPQVWATRPGRARTLARAVDHLLTIHAFDAPYFEREGLDVTFVGNLALSRDFAGVDPERLRSTLGAGPRDPILLVLPGSRIGEVERLMPSFQAAVRTLLAERPDLRVVVAAAESVAGLVRARVEAWGGPIVVLEGEAARLEAMKAATVALACSGTVTTELAQAGSPMVVAYRLDPLTAVIARRLIHTPYITLFNVAAQRFIAPERVQEACTGDILAADLKGLLDDPARRAAQVAAQTAALEIMRGGVGDPNERAAEAVLAAFDRRRS